MYEDRFADRLSQLRIEKGISARDMSLSIGQNAGYITDELYQNLKKLTDSQFESILTIIRELVKGNA